MTELALDTAPLGVAARLRRPLVAAGIVLAEIAVLIFVYRFDLGGMSPVAAPESFCRMLSGSLGVCNSVSQVASRVPLFLLGLVLLFSLRVTRPAMLGIVDEAAVVPRSVGWFWANIVGMALLVLPYGLWVLTQDAALLERVGLWVWLAGAALMLGGLAGWYVSPRSVLRRLGFGALAAIAVFLAFPELAWLFSNRLSAETALQGFTFDTVGAVLQRLSNVVVLVPDEAIISVEDFAVRIGHPCAGLTGIVFSISSVGGYVALMRKELRLARVLWMIPVVVVLSWALNVARIVVLLMIGARVSPDLAVGGFHSYAGWITFTALTGGMIVAIDRIGWFQKVAVRREGLSLWQDPTSAMILPFAVFLFSSLLAGAIYEPVSLGYPLRMAMTVAAVAAFWQCWPVGWRLRFDPVAVAAGGAIAALWVVGQSGADVVGLDEVAPGLVGVGLSLWIAVRLLGTAVVVPVIEELIFRGYLMKRLTPDVAYGPWIGVVASSALFAGLHGNLMLAFGAGIVFGGLYLRRGRLVDAIVAHGIANALIGGWALWTGNWGLI